MRPASLVLLVLLGLAGPAAAQSAGAAQSTPGVRTVVTVAADASATPVTALGSTTPRALRERFSDVRNVRDFGATGDGTTDDTVNIQKAINALSATGGGIVDFPAGTYRTTSALVVTLKNTTFRGAGLFKTNIFYDATSGAAVRINAFQADVSNYASTTDAQGFVMRDMKIRSTYDATAAVRTGTPHGIVDYEGGGIRLENVQMEKLYRGLWGIASDLSTFDGVLVNQCEYGFDMRGRSDQLTFTDLYAFGNYTAVRLSGTRTVRLARAAFVDNVGPDLDIEGKTGTDTDPLGGGGFTGAGTDGARGVTCDTCWFEVFKDKNAGGPWARGQPTKPAYVRVGFGATLVTAPVTGVRLVNSYVGQLAPSTDVVAEAFVRTKYATDTEVDGIAFTSGRAFPIVLSEEALTDSTASTIRHVGTYRVRGVVDSDLGTSDSRWDVGGGKVSPIPQVPTGAVRSSILSNPRLRAGAFGWTFSNASAAAYTPAAGEVLLGEAQTLTASAQFGGMRQTALRMGPANAYEVVIRYKTTASPSALWQLKVTPAASGTPPNLNYYRSLRASSTFVELRFIIPTYADNPLAPRVDLNYLGTSFADTLVVDYLDVQEVSAVQSDARGRRREYFGTAAPTSGAWEVGDVVWSTAPAAGGFMGWVNTAAGSPGTWKTWGAITP